MAFEFYLTEFGKAALIHGLAGGSIAFNVIEIGGAEIPPSDFSKVTALADTKLNTKAISQKQIDNTLNLKFQFDNKKVSSDFFWTEIGYFATVTKSDGNTENGMVLYGYNSKETANHIPSYTSNNTLNKYICQIGINYSDDLNVTITLDEFEDYASKSDFAEHISATNPHNISCNTIGAAKAAHVHSAVDITSGMLGVERGGTGVSSLKKIGIEPLQDYKSQVAFGAVFYNFYNCQFYRKNGIVTLTVTCQINKDVNGDAQAGDAILMLPVGMRPANQLSVIGIASNKEIFTVAINPDGQAIFYSFGSLSIPQATHIRFSATYPAVY